MVAEVIRLHTTNDGFDYDALPSEVRDRARQLAHWVKSETQKVVYGVLKIGEYITEMKGVLDHGEFQAWVEKACQMSITHAENYMHSYQRFGASHKLSGDLRLSQTVIFQLAAPNTPAAVVDEILDRASNGEKVKVEQVKKLKNIHNRLLNQIKADDPIAQSELQQEVLGRARELAKSRDRDLDENDIVNAAQEVAGVTIKRPEPKPRKAQTANITHELEEACRRQRQTILEQNETIDELRQNLKNEETRARSLEAQLELAWAEIRELKGASKFEFLVSEN